MDLSGPWISADWGTTNFRLRLVDAATLNVLSEVTGGPGILSVNTQWSQYQATVPADGNGVDRFHFYLRILQEYMVQLESVSGIALGQAPVMLSGMAGSGIGMITLPYQVMPCPADGSGLNVMLIRPDDAFPHPLLLIPGVCSEDDVMRGEETMLVGAVAAGKAVKGKEWYVLPGTHSKHICVDDNQITQLRTYMTGEVFALLAEKSILADSVEKADPLQELPAFTNGVKEGWQGRLMHSLFSVRTAALLRKTDKKAGYSYLSGMVIGHELRALEGLEKCTLVGSGPLQHAYHAALTYIIPSMGVTLIDSTEALLRGQWKIAEKISTGQ